MPPRPGTIQHAAPHSRDNWWGTHPGPPNPSLDPPIHIPCAPPVGLDTPWHPRSPPTILLHPPGRAEPWGSRGLWGAHAAVEVGSLVPEVGAALVTPPGPGYAPVSVTRAGRARLFLFPHRSQPQASGAPGLRGAVGGTRRNHPWVRGAEGRGRRKGRHGLNWAALVCTGRGESGSASGARGGLVWLTAVSPAAGWPWGHPTAALLLLLLPAANLGHPASPRRRPRRRISPTAPTGCSELDWSIFVAAAPAAPGPQRHRRRAPRRPAWEPTLEELDLSHNELQRLPDAFLKRAQSLRRLLLGHNRLRELPDGFFAATAALQSLELQDNPLPAVPTSAFHPSLSLLAVPCRCNVVGSVLTACARAANLTCLCDAPDGTFDVSSFHQRACLGGSEAVAAAVGATTAVAVLVAVAVGVAVCRRRRKAAAAAGWGKRESAGAHGQPRYISHGAESGPTAAATTTAAAGASVAPEYENVFISPCVGTGTAPAHGGMLGWQRAQYSPQVPADDTYFMESDAGEQPIYANTGPPSEEVYVVPDE
ncbi:uncharacterized protein V3H86_013018 [Mergus octosetaceus]